MFMKLLKRFQSLKGGLMFFDRSNDDNSKLESLEEGSICDDIFQIKILCDEIFKDENKDEDVKND